MKEALKAALPKGIVSHLKSGRDALLRRSLRAAAQEQGLLTLAGKLSSVADVTEQYSTMRMDTPFLRERVLFLHAFQVELAGPALPENGTVVDIGDSSGAHTLYLKALNPERKLDYLSVNLDEGAVEKVAARGLKSLRCRAEELPSRGVRADLFMLFETLEHLPDPFSFLHGLSKLGARLVLTVPYVRRSRLGLHHIRHGLKEPTTAERVHLLELCPEDLRLLFKHTGWKVETDRVYRQYPLRSPLRATRGLWADWDFEGFYGAVLSPDASWSSLYKDWSS